MAEAGPSVAAASRAPPPIMAQAPESVAKAGTAADQAPPRAPPSKAPQVSVGVNRPPGAPLFRQIAVAASRTKISDTISQSGPARSCRLAWTTFRPLPRTWGKGMAATPWTRNARSGAPMSSAVDLARWRSAQAITRT